MYRVVGPVLGSGDSEKHQFDMMQSAIQYLGVGPQKRIFEMEKSRWEAMATSLEDIGRIKKKDLYIDICDFKILDEAEGEAKRK